MKRFVALFTLLSVAMLAGTVSAAVTAADYLGPYGKVYDIVWDGWKGELVLMPDPWRADSKLTASGRNYAVRYEILLEAQQNVGGQTGPGYLGVPTAQKHRIVFWVDFNHTRILTDDQRYDGYIMTQTKNAIAGVTWYRKMPYGFYAIFKYDVPG